MKTAMILLLMTTTAFAQKPITENEIAKLQPSEENKKWFLERGYRLNNNSMVGWGSIDLTGKSPLLDDKVRCVQIDGVTGQQFFECEQPAKIKTERIVPDEPVTKWNEKNVLDAKADVPERNICTIHHMRKVTTSDGQSWRCRK